MVNCLSPLSTLHAQTLSFPATRTDVQYVIQTNLQTPLNLQSLCFSQDGKTLYVGGYKEVLVWSLTEAKLADRITDNQLTNMITAMLVIDDGKTLAVSGTAPTSESLKISQNLTSPILLFDTTTHKRIAKLDQPGDSVTCMALNPDGSQLAVGTYDGRLSIWDTKQRTLLKTFLQQNSCITDIVYSPDQIWLAVSYLSGQVEVFETTSQFPSLIRKSFDDSVRALCFDQSKNLNLAIAVGGKNEVSIRLLNKKNSKRLRKLNGTPSIPLDICWAEKNQTAYLAGTDHTIVSWKKLGKINKTFKAHTNWVTAIALSPDEKGIASVSLDGTTRLWDAKQGLLMATLLQLKPQTDTWLFISSLGTFNASSSDVVHFFKQPKETQSSLRNQWLNPKNVSQHLGFTAKP
ncbi:hypothetical protein JYU15_00770 [bacterium AH-315-I18]|nr:hypothetical protein [bacterium AH-315-I18]